MVTVRGKQDRNTSQASTAFRYPLGSANSETTQSERHSVGTAKSQRPLWLGNGRNTVSRVLSRKRELTEFCCKLGEFREKLGEFALAYR